MNRIPVRVKIVFGLQLLLISAMGLAIALGFVPNDQTATMRGRATLAEAIAVNASAFVSRNDMSGLDAVLRTERGGTPTFYRWACARQTDFSSPISAITMRTGAIPSPARIPRRACSCRFGRRIKCGDRWNSGSGL